MGFTLRQIVGAKVADDLTPVSNCPTGKTAYASKREARLALIGLNRKQTRMKHYRCQFCENYHLGHRRGLV
jgi:hypothetical protein